MNPITPDRLTGPSAGLAREWFGLRTLEQVLDWLKQRGLPLGSLEMVTQDEYSHDLLVPLPAGGGWLGFALT
jgi:hypothetical protein